MTIDPETTPLLAQVTAKGHHIGAADEKNFEFGLECILDHAGRLIDDGGKKPAKTARKRQASPRAKQAPATRSDFGAQRHAQRPLRAEIATRPR